MTLIRILLSAILAVTTMNARPASPYDWTAALTLEAVSNLQGGANTGTSGLTNLDLTVTIDTEMLGWWSGGELFIYGLGNSGDNPSEDVGDLQGISNIATDSAAKIYEFWYRHSVANGQVKLLFGLHDYNSTFYSLDAASLFTHPSFGIGPDTSQVGPSIFSTTAAALLLSIERDTKYLLLGLYDGIPGDPNNPQGTHIQFDKNDGTFIGLEAGLNLADHYKLGLGIWQHSAEVQNPISDALDRDNSGLYVIAEKSINKNQSLFLQFGRADDQSNQLEYYFGTGASVKNIVHDGDALGLALAHARNGASFMAANPPSKHAETAYELSYRTPVIKHLSVQTSLYYIQNPSMDIAFKNALAVGFRAYLEL
jgi:porin